MLEWSSFAVEDQFQISFERAHVRSPLLVQDGPLDGEALVEELIDDFLAEDGVRRQLAQAVIEGEKLIEMLLHQKVGQGPGLAIAVKLGAASAGVVEDLVPHDK